ncbi:disease resistance protein RPV1-like [Cornus florida]|uniref:disease resistance protein RPV1-like n=1 Tax=Cornus florida TaxID=4283 RepID=UPI002899D86E|nr:disease resistance protein RPV1-like [Cornus florida]XP_059631682.1 disease resistance protein RPV1-like [Cornus florida]
MAEDAWSEEASLGVSNNSSLSRTYDIFLSFRGKDTRLFCIDFLYYALVEQGFSTFLDDNELKKGEAIKPGLMKSIEESRISIVVFSENYGFSRWCLDELVKIMECRRNLGQIVLPLFYLVDPADLRWQRGKYAEAFAKHQPRYGDDQIQRWRAALTEVADLSGWTFQNGRLSDLIRSINKVITKILDPSSLNVAEYPVGIEPRAAKVGEVLNLAPDDVRIVAIWGMGGIGKTAIAKAVYNFMHRKFKSSCFLLNVGATWNQLNGDVDLQKLLLSDILPDAKQSITNSARGIEVIKRRAWCQRVLLVLDDVDNVEQLSTLVINRDLLHSGSRVIITTRNLSSISSLQLQENEVYTPEELNKEESLKLFSWHAFKEEGPSEDSKMLSAGVVGYAKGIPLVLKVLGSFFRDLTKSQWISGLEELEKIPHDDVQLVLKLSYDKLNPQQRGLFLDIACFFVRMNKDLAIKILEGRGFNPNSNIEVLVRRALLQIDSDNRLMMHDRIRDMGREIVRQESDQEPGERTRLWNPEEVLDVLENNRGTTRVEGLVLNSPKSDVQQLDANAFARMNRLRLLRINYVRLNGSAEHLSGRLVWLCWNGFPLNHIPSTLLMGNMAAIDLSYSSLKVVWKETKVLNKLKCLNLSHSYSLTKTPDFTGLTSLETLLLNDCTKLRDVHHSIGCLQNLVVLNMKNCQNLRKLPESVFTLKSVIYLDLSGCLKLAVPTYRSWYSIILSLVPPAGILDFSGMLPASIHGLSSISKLYLENCNVCYVPGEIGSCVSLQFLNLSRNNFANLPASITNLSQLKVLYLNQCTELQILPGLPIKLKGLSANYCTSLKMISIESKMDEAPFMTFYGCHILADNFANDFKKNLLQYQGRPEQGDFSIFLPGNEVPNWCNYQCVGSFLSFLVPPLVDRKIQGWILCVVFAGRCDDDDDMFAISYGIYNKTMGTKMYYQPTVDGYPLKCEDQMWLNYVPHRYLESEWKELESPLGGGDRVEMTIRIDKRRQVKKCGVSLIYEGNNEDTLPSNDLPEEMDSLTRLVSDESFLYEIGVLKSKKRGSRVKLGFPIAKGPKQFEQ